MDIDLLVRFLAWCSVVNCGLLLFWFFAMLIAKDLIFKLQGLIDSLPQERLEELNYMVIGLFKMGVLLFNLTPYLVLRALV